MSVMLQTTIAELLEAVGLPPNANLDADLMPRLKELKADHDRMNRVVQLAGWPTFMRDYGDPHINRFVAKPPYKMQIDVPVHLDMRGLGGTACAVRSVIDADLEHQAKLARQADEAMRALEKSTAAARVSTGVDLFGSGQVEAPRKSLLWWNRG